MALRTLMFRSPKRSLERRRKTHYVAILPTRWEESACSLNLTWAEYYGDRIHSAARCSWKCRSLSENSYFIMRTIPRRCNTPGTKGTYETRSQQYHWPIRLANVYILGERCLERWKTVYQRCISEGQSHSYQPNLSLALRWKNYVYFQGRRKKIGSCPSWETSTQNWREPQNSTKTIAPHSPLTFYHHWKILCGRHATITIDW